MPVIYRNWKTGETREFDEPDYETAHDRDWAIDSDDRTVLYALPEDQPDSLSEGQTSNQADLDITPAEREAAEAPDNAGPPAKSAPKAAWVDWAVENGEHRGDAEAMTKDDLISIHGN